MKQRIKNKISKSYDAWITAVWKLKNGIPLTKKDWQARLPYNEQQIDRVIPKDVSIMVRIEKTLKQNEKGRKDKYST